MKKIYVFLIALFSLIFIFAASISAADTLIAEGSSGENITWKLYDRNSETADKPHYKLVFSGSGAILGYTSDGAALGYNNSNKSQFAPWRDYIYEVVVEDGITEIGKSGLGFLGNVAAIELPESVTSLGNEAFAANEFLERISVKGKNTFLGADFSNITSIGTHIFDGCKSLRYVHLNPSYEGQLKNEVFKNCDSLKTIYIPAGVTGIGSDTFEGADGLESVVFLGDPTIGDNTFLYLTPANITLYSPVSGGNVETFAKAKGFGFSNTTPAIESEFYSSDSNVIDIGKCADDVFYKIVKEGEQHVMYTFGDGSAMGAVSFAGTSVGYFTIDKCYWYAHRNLINKVVLSDNVKTMSGIACGFMGNLTQLEITENLTGITGACFEASSKFGCIYMRGDEPKEGHLDLTNIMRLGSYTFDGCKGVKTAEFAEYPTTKFIGVELFKNCTNLHTVKLPFNITEVRKNAFQNCDSLKNIIFYSDVVIHELAFNACDNIESITGLRDSGAQIFAEANGIEFILPNVLSVYMGEELIEEIDVVDGAFLLPDIIDGMICMLYTDEACTVPYDYSERVYESKNIYAKMLVSHAGFMVRTADYNGLRSIYDFDLVTAKGNSLYNIKEMGSISSLERDIRGTTSMTFDDNHIFSNPVVKNNVITGKLTKFPEGTRTQFAHTATGYENNGVLDGKSATEPLYFRCYVILQNKLTGETYEIYTDVVSATLKEKTAKTLEAGSGILDADELEFIREAANAVYDRDMLYTKDELMAYMNTMYEDIDHILYGQHIDIGSVNSFANYLADFRDETGDYPAVAGIDQGTINGAMLTEEETLIFRNDLIEYAKRGGIISLSFHMDNPTDESLYCRGKLGFEDAWEELMTEGTETNTSLMNSLATAAETLQYLEDAGVPVLFRPLHEMNGGWFWWCTVQSADGKTRVLDGEYVARLWRYFYEYFEVTCDLDNLLWVYSPNYSNNTSTTSGTQSVMHCYPGDEYVDIVGCDWYTGTGNYADIDGAGKSYSSIIATGKPACITEFGPSGNLLPVDDGEHPYKAMLQLQLMKDIAYELDYSMIYILNWSAKWSIYKMGDSNEFMADEMIYGANESYAGLIGSKLN